MWFIDLVLRVVYVFKTYICFGVRHDSRTLFIGAGRDECAMFGLLEPGLVLGLVAYLA